MIVAAIICATIITLYGLTRWAAAYDALPKASHCDRGRHEWGVWKPIENYRGYGHSQERFCKVCNKREAIG